MNYKPLEQFDFSYGERAYNFVAIIAVNESINEDTEIFLPLRVIKKWSVGDHGDWEGQLNISEELAKDVRGQFLHFNKLKQAASFAAEMVCDRIRFTIHEYYKKHKDATIDSQNPVRSFPHLVFRMDFMALADEYRHLIKSKKIDHQLFKDPITSRAFRQKLNTLVLERNIFTHGSMAFSLTEQQFFIESIDSKAGKPIYWKITEMGFIDYFKLIKFIMQPLSMPEEGKASLSIRYPNGYQ